MELNLRLVRHGSTGWTAERRYTGHADLSLDWRGRTEAKALSEALCGRYDSVWTSDLQRCVETARLAGLEATPTSALREFDFGLLEGKTWDELEPATQSALAAFDGFQAPGGESVAAFGERIDCFVDSLVAGRHLLVTHGGVIRHLTRRAGEDKLVAPAGWCDLDIAK